MVVVFFSSKKTLDPNSGSGLDPDKVPYSPGMLDPDPDSMHTDPQHCQKHTDPEHWLELFHFPWWFGLNMWLFFRSNSYEDL